jgi:hypothetical protein
LEVLNEQLQGHPSEWSAKAERLRAESLPESPVATECELRAHAEATAQGWETTASSEGNTGMRQRLEVLAAKLEKAQREAGTRVGDADAAQRSELLKSRRLLESVIAGTEIDLKQFLKLPQVHVSRHGAVPRIVSLAQAYLSVARGIWSPDSIAVYLEGIQSQHELLLHEVLLLPQALKFAQLEYILDLGADGFASYPAAAEEHTALAACIHSLVRLNQYEWRPLLESAVRFDAVLREDPGGIFAKMDDDTRYSYLVRVAHLARHADFNEYETARAAIAMAQAAEAAGDEDPRRAQRTQHVGYYLMAQGLPALKQKIGYHAPPAERLRALLRRYNEDVYIIGILTVSLLLIVPIIAPLVPHHEFWLVMVGLLLALLPMTQGAVDIVNQVVAFFLKPEALPKLDYSDGVPEEATTLVVVPTLLLRETQVRGLFEELEARYLSNEDPNIHFALLTDFPDSAARPASEVDHPLVQMAIRWTEDLNAKYAKGRGGAFLLLHRHRVYNARQGVWMGWERKRGKLLDLNKLLLHRYDSFPIKAGALDVLERVRYVITLDSDTKLPYSAAARMIGTICHPLNRAIVNKKSGIVTVGYGILQPRVGVSVASASRSRLAAIYSGETGFDIYTRAVSDVYQDLFGEGIFTGKGIYEASVLNQVLEGRFPRNSLLSHDLIEGAYARAGLVTDVEVIDDYPSQYLAHTRRKHRWIRGDWQILRWLFSPVPDEAGNLVTNPISLISQWKIFDNLRRSLVEPVTFLVLIFGWFFLPGGALYWTVVTITLLLLGAMVQLSFDTARAVFRMNLVAARAAVSTFAGSITMALINLTFLAHQAVLSLDAIVRTLNRSLFSGRHLLEWETAAQAESSDKRTSIDVYLQLSPALALLLASGLWLHERSALYAAGPVLFLWLIAPFAAKWLNSDPRKVEAPLSDRDKQFLEEQALRIWRFYADFSGPESQWLVPDNVEEKDLHAVRMLTPTNIGMLLNARQAAVELGFLTVPEFVEAARGALASFERLEKHRGHVYNWYDLESLQPILPVVVSTVDSGNLGAALYTLHMGALDLLSRPLLSGESFALVDATRTERAKEGDADGLLRLRVAELYAHAAQATTTPPGIAHAQWLSEEVVRRRAALVKTVDAYLPWLRPEFVALAEVCAPLERPLPGLERLEPYIDELSAALMKVKPEDRHYARAADLAVLLPAALESSRRLTDELKCISDMAERFAEDMDYRFLFVGARQLLSNGYDMARCELHAPCFDLLASEARMAAFLAVAKGDAPQQSWFRLDRSHVIVKGRAVLLSWTATMFEYLMPTLWMRSYPDTLLTNSLDAVVHVQRDAVRGMPWGISESGYATTDANGRYLYQAWGVPTLALKYEAESGPVISPYSTFLALPLAPKAAIRNLRRMEKLGWVGEYGFYEAADYIEANTLHGKPRLVQSWMAHHQGMSLLAITNFLRQNILQTWFHSNPRVRAAEELLHEKALNKQTLSELSKQAQARAKAE